MGQPFGFTGYQRDEVAGTYFAQAREYRAEAGRFVGQDIIKGVIRQPITLNQYLYCWSNPVAFMDLDGMQPQKSADFYDNTTIEPLDPNKKYYTFEENPNTEKGTFSIGGTIDATIFIGISLDMFVSVDRYGNIALQTSIAEPFNDRYDTKYIGGFDFGLGIKLQITKAKTVFDLEKKGESAGGSAAFGGYFGLDGINLNEDNSLEGAAITIGSGVGVDSHIVNSYTTTMFSINLMEKWRSLKIALGLEEECNND